MIAVRAISSERGLLDLGYGPAGAGDFLRVSMVQVVCDHHVCVADALRGIPGNQEVTCGLGGRHGPSRLADTGLGTGRLRGKSGLPVPGNRTWLPWTD